jgi:hypothetical protein
MSNKKKDSNWVVVSKKVFNKKQGIPNKTRSLNTKQPLQTLVDENVQTIK